MSLGYTAHSIQDSSHKQIGLTQKKKKYIYIYISQKDILNFKQKTVSIYLNLSMSQCLSLFLNNMKLFINELYLNSGSHELKNIQY